MLKTWLCNVFLLQWTKLENEPSSRLQQIRENKKSEVLAAKRAMGGVNFPPILTGIICIDGSTGNVGPIDDVINVLTNCDAEIDSSVCSSGVVHLSVPKFKKRFSFLTLDARDLNGVLDASKVCDSLIFLASAEGFDVQVIAYNTYLFNSAI